MRSLTDRLVVSCETCHALVLKVKIDDHMAWHVSRLQEYPAVERFEIARWRPELFVKVRIDEDGLDPPATREVD